LKISVSTFESEYFERNVGDNKELTKIKQLIPTAPFKRNEFAEQVPQTWVTPGLTSEYLASKKMSPQNKDPLATYTKNEKEELKNLVNLKLLISRKTLGPSAITNLKHNPVTYLKNSKMFDIIDDLVLEERNRLRAHLETHINKKIPVNNKKWKENTLTLVKILIHLEVDIDGIATYKDIKDQILMD
jgi:hypothetical protein